MDELTHQSRTTNLREPRHLPSSLQLPIPIPAPNSAYPSGGIAPGFQALKFNHTPPLRRTRVSGPTQIPGGTSPPGYSNIQGPSPSNPREEKGGSWHSTDGVPPEPSSPSWVTEPGSQWLPSVVPPGELQTPKTPGAKRGS